MITAAALLTSAFACFAAPDGTRFGHRVLGIDDVDADGVPDFAVSATSARRVGAVLVYSGSTRRVLLRIDCPGPGYGFGATLELYDDVDGDGVRDLFVGKVGGARAYVVSATDGTLLRTFDWRRPGEPTSATDHRAALVGDLDGDGRGDLAVISGGVLAVLSGEDGIVLVQRELRGAAWIVGAVGDLNRDGTSEVLVDSQLDERRRSHMYFVDRALSWSPLPDLPRSEDGTVWAPFTARPFGDIDADGAPEFLTSSPVGAEIRSGWQMEVVRRPTERVGYESDAIALPDLDGDSVPDFALGIDTLFTGVVEARSGASGARLWSFEHSVELNSKVQLALVADLDGDGFPELLAGMADLVPHGTIFPGCIHILSGRSGTRLWSQDEAQVSAVLAR